MSVFDRLAAHYATHLRLPLGRAALDYMLDRKFTDASLRTFQVGFAPSVWDFNPSPDELRILQQAQHFDHNGRDLFAGRIVFPIADDRGSVKGFCGRTIGKTRAPKYFVSPETEYFKKGDYLYGLDLARERIFKENKVILCEGFTDSIAYRQVGIPVACSLMGVKLTDVQLTTLAKYTDNVYTSLDPDAAGNPATVKMMAKLREYGFTVSKITLPTGQDPASYLLS